MTQKKLHIIGAGLAGSEAAWQAANLGVSVVLHEMRPQVKTAAHETEHCAELVCSNSFRSDDAEHNAVGLLHNEMRKLNSLVMREGDKAAVPAGGALAVDRNIFAQNVTAALNAHPNITVTKGEVTSPEQEGWEHVIVASGPLTSDALSRSIQDLTGQDALAFFDAIAPIVHMESVDMGTAWFQSRYDKVGPAGTGKDYLNCPMTEEQYRDFVDALITAEYGDFKQWEKDTPYFDGCMPVEVMAERGVETLRFGPMKPVGLTNPHDPDTKPYAVVQLRQDNALGTLYNIVGFQTKMKYGEQTRVFRMIPGLENAEFARLGGMHRNTFINSPKILNETLAMNTHPHIRFAGQITGCEGYVESAAIGGMAGRFAAAEILGDIPQTPPKTTAHGALLHHITGGANADTFQPMNVNFGLFPLPDDDLLRPRQANGKRRKLKGMDRKRVYTDCAKRDFDAWVQDKNVPITARVA